MITKEDIGANIRDTRRKKGWNQNELGKRVKPKPLSKDTISRIERGVTNFTIETLMGIAEALEIDLTQLCPAEKKEPYPLLEDFRRGLERVIQDVFEKYGGRTQGSI